jgi:hypothetical protein
MGRSAYRILVGKPEGKRQLGRSKRMWRIILKYLREMGWDGINWIHLDQDRD